MAEQSSNDAASNWDEVGQRFSALGKTLQDRWSTTRQEGHAAGESAEEEVREAVDGVKASLDQLADSITATVNDEDVHRAARSAAGGFVEALSSSLDQLAERIDRGVESRRNRADETD